MRRAMLAVGVLAICLGVFTTVAHAEDVRAAVPASSMGFGQQGRIERDSPCCPTPCLPRQAVCDPCGWQVSLSLGGWIAGLDGHNVVRGRRSDVELSSLDTLNAIFDYGEGVFQGRVRLSYGPWSVRFAGLTMTLADGADFSEGPVRGIDAEIGMDLFQADVGYRLGTKRVGGTCECPNTIRYDAFAGFRYFNVDATIEARGALAKVSGDKDFFDPILGARATLAVGRRWSFDFEGDIGGFGVGSDLTWGLRAGARYQVARWFSVELGYKLIDIDYAAGSGPGRFEWDVLMYGPYLALTFHL